jgi:ribosomal protein S18 acetylase RimI-like enzyme
MEIRTLGPADAAAVVAASDLFDGPASKRIAQRFLDSEGHYLLVAYEEDQPVGFVSGVEMTHPDKGTEMFLYELGVSEPFRRRRIGTALVMTLRQTAIDNGCYGMWVLTDVDNVVALATYAGARATERSTHVMLTWNFTAQETE